MKNPFDSLSELSVDRPKTAIAVAVIGILALSSFAQFIVFDNSEDAFYPENETTDLLYEVEDTYTVDIDLIRAIVRFDSGDLQTSQTAWELLAETEYEMMTNPEMSEYHYGLFGGSANSGPASSVMFWQKVQDPGSDTWSEGLQEALNEVMTAGDENLSLAVGQALTLLTSVPDTNFPTSEELLGWSPGSPQEWQARLDSGESNAEAIGALIGTVSSLNFSTIASTRAL